MTELIQEDKLITINVVNSKLPLIEFSVIRLLQLQEMIEKTQEKLSFLGLDASEASHVLQSLRETDTVAIDLLSDVIILQKAKKEEMIFLSSTEADIDLVLYGKLSWKSCLVGQNVLLSWQLGDGCTIDFYRKPGQIFENRIKIKV